MYARDGIGVLYRGVLTTATRQAVAAGGTRCSSCRRRFVQGGVSELFRPLTDLANRIDHDVGLLELNERPGISLALADGSSRFAPAARKASLNRLRSAAI
jgi:hypothetical protein